MSRNMKCDVILKLKKGFLVNKMGMRAQVLIEDTGVYLYTHWGSETLVNVVKDTVRQGWRLNDPEYFTRILFEKMIDNEDARGTETGFGIGTTEHSDLEYPSIKVNCKKGIIKYVDDEHWEFFDDLKPKGVNQDISF